MIFRFERISFPFFGWMRDIITERSLGDKVKKRRRKE
jgi:hypothetical protein